MRAPAPGRPAVRGLAIWLCLVLSLASGLSPAQALVLCVEAEGSVSLELVLDGSACDGCPAAGGLRLRPEVSQLAQAPANCACIDIPLATVVEQRRLHDERGSASAERHWPAWPAGTAPQLETPRAGFVGVDAATAVPAQGAHLLRSVVRLV